MRHLKHAGGVEGRGVGGRKWRHAGPHCTEGLPTGWELMGLHCLCFQGHTVRGAGGSQCEGEVQGSSIGTQGVSVRMRILFTGAVELVSCRRSSFHSEANVAEGRLMFGQHEGRGPKGVAVGHVFLSSPLITR